MADIKWIKLSADVFNNRKVKIIEKMPDGDSLIVIWIKLLCLAGTVNDSGLVYLTKDVPYTDEMLSVAFDRPLQTVRLALSTFERFGMIEIINDILMLPSWEKYQNIGGLAKIQEQTRDRVAKHRQNQRALMGMVNCAYCGERATGVDHVVATASGGSDNSDNKVPCCIDCNRIKNDKPLVDFLNNNRERIMDESVLQTAQLSKLVTLCNVTDRYIVTRCNATEEELDKDKEIEKEPPHTPLDGGANNDDPQVDEISSRCFSPELESAVRDWVTYKNEKRQGYKPMGLRNLLTTIKNNVDIYGEPAVIALMSECMASNWQGIMFDRLRNGKPAQPPAQKKKLSYRIEVIDGEEVAVIDR